MELQYNVIIDTKQAQASVEDIERVFDEMGKSTDKNIKKLSQWGKEITEDMKSGKLTTTEAMQSINALQNEVRRLSATNSVTSKESKTQLRQANQELTLLGQSVKKLEVAKTQAHTKDMRQLREEQRERQKIEAIEKREEARNKRMNIATSRRASRALAGMGMAEAGKALGGITSLAKFGVGGALVGGGFVALEGLVSGIKKLIERYNIKFDWFTNFFSSWSGKLLFAIDTVAHKIGISEKTAGERKVEDTVAKRREEYSEIKEALERIKQEGLSTKELTENIKKIRKYEAFKGYSDEQLITTDITKLVKALNKEYEEKINRIASYEAGESAISVKNKYKKGTIRAYSKGETLYADSSNSPAMLAFNENERDLARMNKRFDELFNKEKRLASEQDEMAQLAERIEKAEAKRASLTEAVTREYREQVNLTLGRYEKQKETLLSEERLTRLTADKKAEKERIENYEKAMQAINGIAKADKGSTYGELLVNANETKKAQLKKLEQYKQYANTEEYQKALARIDAQFKDSVDEVNKIVGDMFDEIDSKFEESSENSLQKTRRNIHDAYEKMRKELKDFLKIEEVYEERERKLNELENRALEDADLEHSLKMITKESEAKENAIKTSTKYLDEEERENDIKREQIASIEKQIEAIQKQNHVSEEERDMLEQLRMQWSMLRREIEQTAEERKKYYDEERRLAIVEGITNIGGTLSSSSNPYVSAIGSMMGNFSGIQDMQRLRAQQLQYMKAEDQAWLKDNFEGAEAARAGARASKAQATASAVSAAVQFGADVFNAFADSAEQGRQALADWNAKLADSAHQLAMLTIEEYEYKQRNIFGVDDPYKKMQASLDKERAAQQEAAKALSKMANEGIIQTGTKKKADGKTVAQLAASGAGAGALIGAAAGSSATPVGTIIGTAAGAITGAIAGIIAGRKEVAVYDFLKNKYGEVYDKDTLEINKQILADYSKMDDATKKLVDNAKELLAVQKEAHEEFLSYIQDMVGTMGSDISNILVQAFRSKDIKTAMDDLKGYLTQTIEGVLQEEVFGIVFGDAFDSLEAQLKNIRNSEGQIVGKIDEPLAPFFHAIEDGMAEYADIMNALQTKYKGYGLDIFGNIEEQQQALQGAISGMSEETAGKINGNFLGLKLTAMEISDRVSAINTMFDDANRIARTSLDALNQIAENTAFCQRLDRLASDVADIRSNGLICR